MTTTIKDITILLDEKCISYRDSELQRLLEKLDHYDLSLLYCLLSDIAEIAVESDELQYEYDRGYDKGDDDGYDRGWQEGYDQALRETEG